jgi:signal transduction histidine kinase/ActR/RegA family two-component response regulator
MATKTILGQSASIVAWVTGGVLGVVLCTVLGLSCRQYYLATVEQGQTIARLTAENLTGALAFEDPQTAEIFLQTLSSSEHVVKATVVRSGQGVFADYEIRTPQFDRLMLPLNENITLENEVLGEFTLWVDVWPAFRFGLQWAFFGLGCWIAGTFVAFFLARKFYEQISHPIGNLSSLMTGVAEREDYTQRSSDGVIEEVNDLGRAFNGMLITIQDREERLRRAITDLEQARDSAQASVRSKSAFVANMSHEIRTPMNGILGMASLLRKTDMTEQQIRYFKTMEDSAQSLLLIIDDLLDFSELESGNMTLVEEPYSPSDMLASVHTFFAEMAKEKRVELTVTIASEIPDKVLGDPRRVRQVTLNLVGNALKFTERGRVAVTVNERLEGGARLLRFSITDTGIGIAEAKHGQLFSEFFQADFSSTRRAGGSGLGLAISKRLVTLMGGTIDFHSRVDEGSTFWFEVPVVETVANPFNRALGILPPKRSVESQVNHEPLFPADRGVLVAEDSEVNQLIIKEMLGLFGLHPDIVSNGREALAAFSQKAYALVLMDIQMPVMDGVEATNRIMSLQQDGVNEHCAIVGLSAHATRGDRSKYLSMGMVEYLTKPILIDELERILKEFLMPEQD